MTTLSISVTYMALSFQQKVYVPPSQKYWLHFSTTDWVWFSSQKLTTNKLHVYSYLLMKTMDQIMYFS